jgi:PAS domain S-box-containing protein
LPFGGSVTLLASAIGQIGEAVVITDTAATIQYVNAAFTRITGYTVEEAVGQNTRFLKSDRQDPAYYQDLWKTILSGRVWQGEIINRRKDGTHYTEEMSITPVRDPSGAIAHFIAIQQDVTDRRVTEAALQSSVKSLEEVQHIAPLGSWELDFEASEFRGSDGFFRIFDWPPSADPLPFGKVKEAIPAADRERVNQALRNTLATQEPFDLEHQVVRRDGTVRVVRSRGQVVASLTPGSARLVGTTLDITDGKLAHEKLRQSEEKYRAVVTNVPDVVWTSDATGNPIFVSPNCERVYGYTPEETCNPGFFFSRIHRDDYPRIAEAHRAFLTGQAGFDEQFRIQRKDGEWIWIHDKAVASYEKDGNMYTHGIISDITERRLMEESLRESEERYRRLFEVESDAIFVVDCDTGRILEANAAALKLYGFSREEFQLLRAERVSAEPEKTRAAIVDHRPSVQLRQHRKKDGTVFPVEIASNCFVNRGRNILVAAIRDTTERQRTEEALRGTEDRLALALEAANDGLWDWDLMTGHAYFSPRYFSMLGYAAGELPSSYETWLHLLHPDDRSSVVPAIQKYIERQDESFEVEFRLKAKTGKWRWILSRGKVVVRDGQGRPQRLVGTHVDITERKQAEEGVAGKRGAVPAVGGDHSRGLLYQHARAGQSDIRQSGLRRNLG